MHARYHDQDAGLQFTRLVIAKALQHLSMSTLSIGGPRGGPADFGFMAKQSDIAERRWGDVDPDVVAVVRANEVAGTTTAGSELGGTNRFAREFVEMLAGAIVFDRLPLRDVPLSVVVAGAGTASTAFWTAESKAAPLTALDFEAPVEVAAKKVTALCVTSNELVRDASVAAERWIRDALVKAIASRVDTTFLSTDAASAAHPAGLLNGVVPHSSTGEPAGDLQVLLASFITAKNLDALAIVTTPTIAAAISTASLSTGGAVLDMGPRGGELAGIPVYTSSYAPSGALIMLATDSIWRTDLGVSFAISRNATLEQSSAPTGATDTPTAATAMLTSMFQEESTAIKVVRPINFGKLRTSAVAWIDNASYPVAS